MEQTGNPAFKNKAITSLEDTSGKTMTKFGTYAKTGILLIFCVAAAALSWRAVDNGTIGSNIGWLPILGSGIAALILGLIISFKPMSAPILSVPYAILEGILLGIISATYASAYDGIVGQAIFATIVAFVTVYLGYSFGFLRASKKFIKVMIISIFSIALIYLVTFVMSLFNLNTSFITGSSGFSIGLSVFIVIVAALSLILDFDFIEKASKQNMPKYFEWYGAFGLLVGLVWLYLEILRLLGKIAGRN